MFPSVCLPCLVSICPAQHPPQFHCPPRLCCALLPVLFSLLGRFRFRLCLFSSNRRQTPMLAPQPVSCSPSHSSRALPSAGYGSAPGQPSPCGAPEPCLQLSCLGKALALLHWGRGQVCDCSLSCSLWLLTRPSCPRDLRCVLSPDFPLWKMGAVVLRASSGSFFGAWQRSHLAERRLLPG